VYSKPKEEVDLLNPGKPGRVGQNNAFKREARRNCAMNVEKVHMAVQKRYAVRSGVGALRIWDLFLY